MSKGKRKERPRNPNGTLMNKEQMAEHAKKQAEKEQDGSATAVAEPDSQADMVAYLQRQVEMLTMAMKLGGGNNASHFKDPLDVKDGDPVSPGQPLRDGWGYRSDNGILYAHEGAKTYAKRRADENPEEKYLYAFRCDSGLQRKTLGVLDQVYRYAKRKWHLSPLDQREVVRIVVNKTFAAMITSTREWDGVPIHVAKFEGDPDFERLENIQPRFRIVPSESKNPAVKKQEEDQPDLALGYICGPDIYNPEAYALTNISN
jgi:hypothetical protein